MTTPFRLPQIKVLTSETNKSSADVKNTATATVNIVPDASVKYVEDDIAVIEPTRFASRSDGSVITPTTTREITPDNEVNVYKLLLEAYKNNPLKIMDCVIMTSSGLCQLIKEITGVKLVEITAEADVSCCGIASKYNTIQGIVCIMDDDTRVDFEVSFNKDYRLLKDYMISTKITYDP